MRLPILRLLYPLVVLAIFLHSCDNPAALTPGNQGDNIVTGIFITNETSPEALAVWGTPNQNFPDPLQVSSDSQNCQPVENEECFEAPITFFISTPYPNPSDGNITLEYGLPHATNVSVWVESATWVGENSTLPLQTKRPFQVFVYLDNVAQTAGHFSLRMDINSVCSGGEAFPGFYRIFLRTNNWLSWQDIYIYGPTGTNPPGLGDYGYFTAEGCDPDRSFD